jgi:hypothetical protein
VVSVFDREGDVFEVFDTARKPGFESRVLVRAKSNRALLDEDEEDLGYLWEEMGKAPVAGEAVIVKPRSLKDRTPRKAKLSIRFKDVTLRVPKNKRKSDGFEPAKVTAVYAHEDDPPKGVEEPISWMLLTTEPVNSADEAFERVSWYSSRWQIEVFFKVMKSGNSRRGID